MPGAFTAQFLDRLHEGKLDCGRALDHCELNPSPAARVALAAVRRWGRPAADLERAVALAHRVETDRLRRNVGTLRRIAVLSALLGLLGTLFALGRALEGVPDRGLSGRHRSGRLRAGSAGVRVGTRAGLGLDPALFRHHHRHLGLGRLRWLAHPRREALGGARPAGCRNHRRHRHGGTDAPAADHARPGGAALSRCQVGSRIRRLCPTGTNSSLLALPSR